MRLTMLNLLFSIVLLTFTRCEATSDENSYWDMWQYYDAPFKLFISKIYGNFTLDLNKVPNITNYDQIRLQLYCSLPNQGGANTPWQINILSSSPPFQHKTYGYANTGNELTYNSQNIIAPIPKDKKLSISIIGNGGNAFLQIYVLAVKHSSSSYLAQHPELAAHSFPDIKQSWQDWVYFSPIKYIDNNITSATFTLNYSNIPNISLYECLKHYAYFATGKTYNSNKFQIYWYNLGKPQFQHRTFGEAYTYNAGFAYNSENIIVPVSSERTLKFKPNFTPMGGYDFMRVFVFGAKFKYGVSLQSRLDAQRHLKLYAANPSLYQNSNSVVQSANLKTQVQQIQIKASYPYPGYWDDWFYFEPIVMYDGKTTKGNYTFDFSKIFGSKVCDQIKIMVVTRNGVSNGGQANQVFLNDADGPKFRYTTTDSSNSRGGVTYNSEQFIAPKSSKSKMYYVIESTFSGNAFSYVQVVGLKFIHTVSQEERRQILMKLRNKSIQIIE